MSKITVDFDAVTTELDTLKESLDGVQEYAAALYDMVAPVNMTDDLPYGAFDQWAGFDATYSCEALHSMKSGFIKEYAKLWNGLRSKLESNIIKKLEAFYNSMVTVFAVMSASEQDSENYIIQKMQNET